MEDDLWRMSAACRGEDPAIFIPEPTDDRRLIRLQHARALAYCEQCPVASECLQWALDAGEETSGIYGNTTPRQRRSIREHRQRRAAEQRELVGACS